MADTIETVVPPVVEKDELTIANERIAQITEERDNYKNVALKRLGKLPNDDEFMNKEGEEMTVAEQVRVALIDRELEKAQQEKDNTIAKMAKENAELRLSLKNQPQLGSGGSGAGASVEVKDSTFTTEQLDALKARAISRGLDPEKFIENFKKNLPK